MFSSRRQAAFNIMYVEICVRRAFVGLDYAKNVMLEYTAYYETSSLKSRTIFADY